MRDIAPETFDPQGVAKFRLDREAKIASAGSCFAVRVAEYLRATKFNYMDVETGGAILPRALATRYGYLPLPARFGNVYTSRQLLQLFDRAFGRFSPAETSWESGTGYVDPFRPRIQPRPFGSIAELEADRRSHLQAVRSMFEQLDVFIFTLGLTEVWASRLDGAVYPACPGRGFGSFDYKKYEFVNLDVEAVVEDLERFITSLSDVNRAAKIIFTVSPVAIAATMLPMHVVRASMLAKSTLLIAAETVAARHEHVDYFASYETVMHGGGRDAFMSDRRHISEPYVERVVAGLLSHYFEVDFSTLPREDSSITDVDVKLCDEDELAMLIEAENKRSSR